MSEELNKKAQQVLKQFPEEGKVYAFEDGNIFREGDLSLANLYKKETNKTYTAIERVKEAPKAKEKEEPKA